MIYIHIITVFIYIFFYFYVSMVLRFVDHAEDICRRASNRCHLCRVAHNCCAGRRLSFAATQCQFFFFFMDTFRDQCILHYPLTFFFSLPFFYSSMMMKIANFYEKTCCIEYHVVRTRNRGRL